MSLWHIVVMAEERTYTSPLRQRQLEETRLLMVNTALDMLGEQPDEPVTHEEIAKRVQVGLRTVYRYFPSRSDLLDAIWQESTKRLRLTEFPDSEAKLLEAVVPVFSRMDENTGLMRGLLRSNAGQSLRRADNDRRRAGVVEALEEATKHLPKDERLRVVGVFQTLFSARAWEIMRDRTHLKEGEPAKAVLWAMNTLLAALYKEQKQAAKSALQKEDRPARTKKS